MKDHKVHHLLKEACKFWRIHEKNVGDFIMTNQQGVRIDNNEYIWNIFLANKSTLHNINFNMIHKYMNVENNFLSIFFIKKLTSKAAKGFIELEKYD